MKIIELKHFFFSPFTIYSKTDSKHVEGYLKTSQKILLILPSLLLIPTLLGAPLFFFGGAAFLRSRFVVIDVDASPKIGEEQIFWLEERCRPLINLLKEWIYLNEGESKIDQQKFQQLVENFSSRGFLQLSCTPHTFSVEMELLETQEGLELKACGVVLQTLAGQAKGEFLFALLKILVSEEITIDTVTQPLSFFLKISTPALENGAKIIFEIIPAPLGSEKEETPVSYSDTLTESD